LDNAYRQFAPALSFINKMERYTDYWISGQLHQNEQHTFITNNCRDFEKSRKFTSNAIGKWTNKLSYQAKLLVVKH